MTSNYQEITQENIRRRGEEFDDIGKLIAEQLYSDRTHFIYELLQNAEDALSRLIQHQPNSTLQKRVTFRLFSNRLEVSHFGQPFNEADVRGISDVLRGTKKDDGNQIGKFGIGFKSVYAFTSSPEIHSGDEHFRIERYIRPVLVEPRHLLAGETLFIFPFNHQFESPEDTFNRLKNRFTSLSERTLLFLRHVEEISWSVENGASETFRRKTHNISPGCQRINISSKKQEQWLVFDKAINSNPAIKVEIAFLLSLDKQTKKERIVPVNGSRLVVFLPTEIETDLQFLVQGPYRTTPARDNIRRDDNFNRQLIEHTATLVGEVLPKIRALGLLTVNCLNVFPIRKSDFQKNPLFRLVFEKVRQTFREKALLPTTVDGQYIAATQAKLARSTDLRRLLSDNQLRLLYGSTYTWLSDEITQGKTPDIHKYIIEELEVQEIEPEDFARKFTKSFIEEQTDAWVASFYAFLNKQEALWRADGILRNKPFIRLQNDNHVAPFRSEGLPNAYLPLSPGQETEFSTIKEEVLENKLVGRDAARFLISLGLSQPDVLDEVIEKILPKYEQGTVAKIADSEYECDIKKILQALKQVHLLATNKTAKTDVINKKEQLISKLKSTSFLRATNAKTGHQAYKRPGDIYFISPNLANYFKGNPHAWFLADTCMEPEHFVTLGVSHKVRVYCKKPEAGYIIISSSRGNHKRGVNGFDPNCDIDGLKCALEQPSYGKALDIWNNLLWPNLQHIYGEIQVASNKDFRNPEPPIKQRSKMGNIACSLAWVPDQFGEFHKPCDLSLDDLPDDFIKNLTLAKHLGMKLTSGDEMMKKLNEQYKQVLGTKELTREFLDIAITNMETIYEKFRKGGLSSASENDGDGESKNTIDFFESIDFGKALTETFSRSGSSDLDFDGIPINQLINPELYIKRVRESVSNNKANEPPSNERFKKVPTKKWEAKNNEIRIFLEEEYKGKCQICRYTFSKRDRQPYFEGLYLVSKTRARWIDNRGNVLCLCANCCAKFKQGSVEAGNVLKQIGEAVEKANPTLTIRLCGEEVSIHFTRKHMIHLQALLTDSSTAVSC